MPVYVYKSKNTGKTFELFRKISEPEFSKHPKTNEPIERVFTKPAIKFKGSGFYTTDYKLSGQSSDG